MTSRKLRLKKKTEVARKKAQKTSRPSEIPPESRSGPLSKKVAIQHSPLGTLVSGTSKSVNQAQVTSIERSGTSDLQNSLVPSKASKRPASPNAADGTPNSKKILVRSKSPDELFKQIEEKSKDGSLPSMSKTLSGSINAKANIRLSHLKSLSRTLGARQRTFCTQRFYEQTRGTLQVVTD